MPVCPSGHGSAAEDYCDVCGARLVTAPTPAATDLTGPVGVPVGSTSCPGCGTPVEAETRYCESCGFDRVLGVASARRARTSPDPVREAAIEVPAGKDITQPSVRAEITAHLSTRWFAEIQVDRVYFEQTAGDRGLRFPGERPSLLVPLGPGQVRIGRARHGDSPEIDLSDPGISHLHAILLDSADGWRLIDPGSMNGTLLNDEPAPLKQGVAVQVGDGDRIHLGAWTTITLRQKV